ncbi:hypothetical protein B0T20DRAFT_393692 [Sordaria brevicollis]|uniref:Uncharacterized protein n=1 Tax=Sordaria brevicollis TaxID=83679 RepID=A0AAE0UBC8_SORBR|nr:hypothetical protein B0T20DRAFT_393692 [Sordaria brevicollis]
MTSVHSQVPGILMASREADSHSVRGADPELRRKRVLQPPSSRKAETSNNAAEPRRRSHTMIQPFGGSSTRWRSLAPWGHQLKLVHVTLWSLKPLVVEPTEILVVLSSLDGRDNNGGGEDDDDDSDDITHRVTAVNNIILFKNILFFYWKLGISYFYLFTIIVRNKYVILKLRTLRKRIYYFANKRKIRINEVEFPNFRYINL